VIRVILPYHLRTLAGVDKEVRLDLDGPTTWRSALDTLEAAYPMLRGTIRDRTSQERRPMLRYFAGGEDFSFEPPDAPLPEGVAAGREPIRIVGAIAGG
jgi:hypothetical protein